MNIRYANFLMHLNFLNGKKQTWRIKILNVNYYFLTLSFAIFSLISFLLTYFFSLLWQQLRIDKIFLFNFFNYGWEKRKLRKSRDRISGFDWFYKSSWYELAFQVKLINFRRIERQDLIIDKFIVFQFQI